ASGGGDDRESCGTSRSKAATRSGVTSPATSTVTAATSSDLLGVGNGLGGRRAVVAGARPYQAIVGRLLEHVRAPPDGAARRERGCEHLTRDAAFVHHHARVGLDGCVEVAAGLELGHHIDDSAPDLFGAV